MSYKTRSNYAPCYAMSEDQFNNIFKKVDDDHAESEPKTIKETERGHFNGAMDQTIRDVFTEKTERDGCGNPEQTDIQNPIGDSGTSS